MSFQPGASLYTQGFGARAENVEVPHIDVRPPATTDIGYPIGKRWINSVLQTEHTLVSLTSQHGATTANWIIAGGNGSSNITGMMQYFATSEGTTLTGWLPAD